MENETLKLVTKAEQAELLHRVLASSDEDALAETLPTDPDGLHARSGAHKGGNKQQRGFLRRTGDMASISGADDAISFRWKLCLLVSGS